jgi:hypothetical protein
MSKRDYTAQEQEILDLVALCEGQEFTDKFAHLILEQVRRWEFDAMWSKLAERGACDDLGGAEYRRVKREWKSRKFARLRARRAGNLEAFIRRRANVVPSANEGDEAAPAGGALPRRQQGKDVRRQARRETARRGRPDCVVNNE